MKQLLLLASMTSLAAIAALHAPFWGVLFYYHLALLRPQYLWAWALPIEVRWSLIAAGIVLFSVGLQLSRLVNHARVNIITVLILAYGVLQLFSLFTALEPSISQPWAIEYAKILLIALVAGLVIEKLEHIRLIALMALVTLGFIAYETNYLYFVNGRLDILHHGFGGMDNNGAALAIALGLPLAYAFATSANRLWQQGLAAILGLLMMHAVMMSYSRGAMFAALVGVVWILVHHRPRIQVAPLVVVLAIGVFMMAGQEIQDRFFSTTQLREDASVDARVESWEAGWRIAWNKPLTGKGIRNSNSFSHNYGADRAGRTIHNLYLQIAADSGIPAMTVYLGLLGIATWMLGHASRRCRDAADDDELRKTRHPVSRVSDTPSVNWRQYERIMRGLQASLIIFAAGAMLLSLDVFEFAWLLLVVGGAAPALVEARLAEQRSDLATSVDLPDATPSPAPEAKRQPPRRHARKRPAVHLSKGLSYP